MWIVSPSIHLVLHHYQIPPRCKAGGHTAPVQQEHSTPQSNPLHMGCISLKSSTSEVLVTLVF